MAIPVNLENHTLSYFEGGTNTRDAQRLKLRLQEAREIEQETNKLNIPPSSQELYGWLECNVSHVKSKVMEPNKIIC